MAVRMVGREDEKLGDTRTSWEGGGSDSYGRRQSKIMAVGFEGIDGDVGNEAVRGRVADYRV